LRHAAYLGARHSHGTRRPHERYRGLDRRQRDGARGHRPAPRRGWRVRARPHDAVAPLRDRTERSHDLAGGRERARRRHRHRELSARSPGGARGSRRRATFRVMPRLLIADDQQDIIEALALLLKAEGFELESARSPAGILAALERNEYDGALIDLNYARDTTSGQEGLELLARIKAIDATLPVTVMTAWSSVDLAVEAMRRGAYDYIEKPWDNGRLVATARRQVEMARALRAGRRLERELEALRPTPGRPLMIAEAPRMRPVLELMARIAPSDANVLITGEHGTGKELVAQWLHSASGRAARPFVAVNLGGLADGVFESELFGHVKGAFTDARTDRMGRFELADGGSLFLDEVANVSLAQQAKLLRVLQTREVERVGSARARRVDVRIMAATNAVLPDEVAGGRFREDLLFRLNTIEIVLPPLRERRDDILPLARYFLERH